MKNIRLTDSFHSSMTLCSNRPHWSTTELDCEKTKKNIILSIQVLSIKIKINITFIIVFKCFIRFYNS